MMIGETATPADHPSGKLTGTKEATVFMSDQEFVSQDGADLSSTPEQEQAAEALQRAAELVRSREVLPGRTGLGALLFGATIGRFIRLPRFRGRRLRVFAFGLLIVVLSVTTCSFGVDSASLTASYGAPVPASAQAAIRFMEKGAAALQELSSSHTLRLTVTDVEATSVMSLGMMLPELAQTAGRIPPEEIRSATDLEALRERLWREEDAARDSLLVGLPFAQRVLSKLDPRLRTGDVQIRFQESGEVVVAGFVQAWSFRQPAMFVVAPSATAGRLKLDFVEGRLGRLPAPAFVFDLLGDAVARAMVLGRDYAEISELTVGNGTLRFTGRLRG